jgi:hypothetical protein
MRPTRGRGGAAGTLDALMLFDGGAVAPRGTHRMATQLIATPAWLVSLPPAFWLLSFGADAAYRAGLGDAAWDDVAFFAMFGGLVTALLAAVPPLLDRLAHGRAEPRPRRAAAGLELAIVVLYVVNLCLRAYRPGDALPVWMSAGGVVLIVIAAWRSREALQAPARVRRSARVIPIGFHPRRHSAARNA